MPITKFKNSCHIIFKNCSERIQKVYEDYGYQSNISFYPNDEKLIGNILSYSSLDKLRAEYLITPGVINFLVKQEHYFHDENELLWGDNIDDYLEDFFISMILDMQEIPEYTKYLLDFSLTDKTSIKEFFVNNFPHESSKYNELKDKFIDFTYNKYDILDLESLDKQGTIFKLVEEKDVTLNSKLKTPYLSFTKLPDKLDYLAKYILVPILKDLMLVNLIHYPWC